MSYPIKLFCPGYAQEMHFVGPNVAVCWNCTIEEKRKGRTTERVYVRKNQYGMQTPATPHISFIQLYDGLPDDFKDGDEVDRSDDNPVVGGIDPAFARDILGQLALAIAYIEGLPK